MLSGLFKFFAGFGAKTKFQNAKIKATYSGDYCSPDQDSILVLIETFSEKNPQTRGQVAVTSFFNNLQKNDARTNWVFILKNLIIMDRCLQEKLLLHQIAEYRNKMIEQYSGSASQNNVLINKLIIYYFQYLKSKAKAYLKSKASFRLKKQQRTSFLEKLSPQLIFQQIRSCQSLGRSIQNINNIYKNGNKKLDIIQYVFGLLLYSLISCYNIQFICLAILIKKSNNMEYNNLLLTRQFIEKFDTITTKQLLVFVQSNKTMEGFKEMKYKDFFKFQNKFINIIDEIIKNFIQKRQSNTQYIVQQYQQECDNQLQIIRKSFYQKSGTSIINKHFIPIQERLVFELISIENEEDPFQNYKNGFSQQFKLEQKSQNLLKSSKKSSNNESGIFDKTNNKIIQYVNSKDTILFDQIIWDKWINVYSE